MFDERPVEVIKAELAALKQQHDVTVSTERLYLRPVTQADIHDIHRFRQNPRNMQYMTTGVETSTDPYTCHSAERIRLMMHPGRFAFRVQLKATGSSTIGHEQKQGQDQDSQPTIGFLGLFRPPAIGYLFDEPFWGRGYATEAIGAFLKAYWETFPQGLPNLKPADINRVEAWVYEGNQSSCNVLTKCGFRQMKIEPVMRDGGEHIDFMFEAERPVKAALPASVEGSIA